MRAWCAALVAAAVAAAAPGCSIPEKQLVAQAGAPYACLNQPLPTTAKDPVVISGTLMDRYAGQAIANATVEAYQVGVTDRIFAAPPSDAHGAFRQSQGTAGTPRNAYFRVTPNGYLPTYFYPAVPIVDDFSTEIVMFTQAEVATLASAAQVTIDPSLGVFIVGVTDCNRMPVGGATVSASGGQGPVGDVRYFDSTETPSATATSTDALTGTAVIANLPNTNITVRASVDGMTLRSHQIVEMPGIMTGSIIETEIQP